MASPLQEYDQFEIDQRKLAAEDTEICRISTEVHKSSKYAIELNGGKSWQRLGSPVKVEDVT